MPNGSRALIVAVICAFAACGPSGQRRAGAAAVPGVAAPDAAPAGIPVTPSDAAAPPTNPAPGTARADTGAAPTADGAALVDGRDGAGSAPPEMPSPDVAPARDLAADLPPPPAPDARLPDAAPPASSGLVGHWKFDEGQGTIAADATGTGNAGRLLNGPTWVAGGFPGSQPGSFALRFDGADDIVELGVRGLPAIEARKTVAAWVRPDAAGAQGVQTFVLMGNTTTLAAAGFGLIDGQLAVWRWGGVEALSAPAPGPGWHHVAYTYDGVIHTIHLDGLPLVRSFAPPDAGSVMVARVGARGSSGLDPFRGALDDLRIYDRVLGAAELRQLAGRP